MCFTARVGFTREVLNPKPGRNPLHFYKELRIKRMGTKKYSRLESKQPAVVKWERERERDEFYSPSSYFELDREFNQEAGVFPGTRNGCRVPNVS